MRKQHNNQNLRVIVKSLLVSLCLCFNMSAKAQTEIKLSSTIVFSNLFGLSVEHGLNEFMGAEADFYYFRGDGIFDVAYKYYFNPKEGNDNFYAGSMLGVYFQEGGDNNPFIGIQVGYKVVSTKRLLFEVGIGVGRGPNETGGGNFKLHIGYRLNNGKAKHPVGRK